MLVVIWSVMYFITVLSKGEERGRFLGSFTIPSPVYLDDI